MEALLVLPCMLILVAILLFAIALFFGFMAIAVYVGIGFVAGFIIVQSLLAYLGLPIDSWMRNQLLPLIGGIIIGIFFLIHYIKSNT